MRFVPPAPVQLAVPHLQQEHNGDCLAVCAEMMLAYLGAAFTRDQLIRTLRIQPNVGAPFHTIRELERVGVLVGYRRHGTLETLYTLLRHGWPSIAAVFTGPLPYWEVGTGHTVVVVGMDREYIFLNDPSLPSGPIQVRLGDFELAWLEQSELYAVLALR